MKLSLTQIILGVIIILTAIWVTGWMIYQVPGFLRQPDLSTGGEIPKYIDVIPQHNTLFNVSRYGSYLIPVFGIFLVIIATFQRAGAGIKKRTMAIMGITAGVLTAALGYIIAVFGFPTSYHTIVPNENGLLMTTFINPGRSMILPSLLSGVACLAGLAVTVFNIVLLLQLKQKAIV